MRPDKMHVLISAMTLGFFFRSKECRCTVAQLCLSNFAIQFRIGHCRAHGQFNFIPISIKLLDGSVSQERMGGICVAMVRHVIKDQRMLEGEPQNNLPQRQRLKLTSSGMEKELDMSPLMESGNVKVHPVHELNNSVP